uniref:Protein kinase domain-containing protein n=1 Tax=Macrostomum lignano TaxID=282301 RepID=A0A1I8FBV9_9PLAT
MKQRYLAKLQSSALEHRDLGRRSSSSSEFVAPQPPPPPPPKSTASPADSPDDGLFVAPTAPSSTTLAASSSSASATSTAASVRVRHVKAAAEVAEQGEGEQQSFGRRCPLPDGWPETGRAAGATRLLSLMASAAATRSCLWQRHCPCSTRCLRDRATLLLDKAGLGLLLRLLDTPDIRPQQADRLRQRLRNLFPGRATGSADQRQAPGHGRPAQSGHSPGLALVQGGGHPASGGASDHALEAFARRFGLFWRRSGAANSLTSLCWPGSLGLGSFSALLENMSYKTTSQQNRWVALLPARCCSPDAPLLCQQKPQPPTSRASPSVRFSLLMQSEPRTMPPSPISGARLPAKNERRRGPAYDVRIGIDWDCRRSSTTTPSSISPLPVAAVLINLAERQFGRKSTASIPIARLIDRWPSCSMSGRRAGDLNSAAIRRRRRSDRRVGAGGDRSQPPHAAGERRIFTAALQPSSEHMEDSCAAYAGLLLCCCPAGHPALAALIRSPN